MAKDEIKRIRTRLAQGDRIKYQSILPYIDPHRIDMRIFFKEALESLEYQITNNKLETAFRMFDMSGNG